MFHILLDSVITTPRVPRVGAVVRPEHGVGHQLIVGMPRAPLVPFALGPESPELSPALKDRCVYESGRVCPAPHPLQSGQQLDP